MTQIDYHFMITGLLLDPEKKSRVGDEIRVNEDSSKSKLNLHEKYYLEGHRKSPIFMAYHSGLKGNEFDSDPEMIVFLNKIDGNFEYAVMHACESLAKKQKILNLIKTIKHSS